MASESPAAKIDTFIDKKYTPLDKNIKIALGSVLLVLPLVAFYFLFFGPKQEEITKLTTTEKELKDKVTKAQATAANLRHHKDELADAQKTFEEISVVLPKEGEISGLLRNISDLGNSAGLDFVSFQPDTEVEKDFYAEIPLKIQIRGPYHNLGSFLDQVSKLERIVTVDNIKMGKPTEEDGEMLLDCSCNVLSYRFSDKGLNNAASDNAKKKKKK